jgi:hypothetical protein
MFYAENPFILAEREGFEPSVPVTQYARLAARQLDTYPLIVRLATSCVGSQCL